MAIPFLTNTSFSAAVTVASSATAANFITTTDTGIDINGIALTRVAANSAIRVGDGLETLGLLRSYSNLIVATTGTFGGRVGIGEASPDRMLHVNSGTNNANTIFESTDTAVTVRFKDLTGSAQLECRNDFRFLNNAGADQRMVISAAGAIKFNNYGAGTLVTDASGNITVSSGGGAGGPFLPLAGGTMTGNINFNDDVYARFGNGNDLDIGHDASNSRITHNGVGNLIIQNTEDNSDIIFQSDDGSGGVATYFKVDPASQATTFLKRIYLPDDVKAQFGNSSDLKIYHDGSNSYIEDTGSGDLILTSNASSVQINKSTGVNLAKFIVDGSVELYFNSSKKFETTSAGINITGGWVTNGVSVATANVEHTDNVKSLFGNGNDLQIYHDGSNSFIDNSTGNLTIDSGVHLLLKTATGESLANFFANGANELFYDNSKKLSTGSVSVGTATTAGGTLIDGWITTTQTNAVNNTTIATTAYVNNKIALIPAGLVFQGTWNAATNTPTLASGTGTTGHFYIVSVAGSTNLDGITDWKVGDWAVFIEQGASDQWEKIDNSSVLDGLGTGNRVAKWDGSGTSNTLTNSGISDASNALAITINGNEEVGIGGNPFHKLDVYGTARISGTATFGGDVSVEDNLYLTDSGTNRAKIQLNSSDRDDLDIIAVSLGSNMKFFTVDSERMRINSAGNVGIGTTSPDGSLTVDNTSSTVPNILLTNTAGNSSQILMYDNSGGTQNASITFDQTSQNTLTIATGYQSPTDLNRINIAPAGNVALTAISGSTGAAATRVGIGTTSPSYTLDVDGVIRGKQYLRLKDTAGTNRFSIRSESTFSTLDNGSNTLNYNAGFHLFLVGLSEKMRINSSGNVGIGTTSPADKLDLFDVNDNVGIYFHTTTSGTGGGDGLRVGQNNANAFVWNYEATPLAFATSGAARLTVAANGNIKFNTYGAGTLVTDASGNITVSSGGGAGGPFLPLTAGSTKPLTGDLYLKTTNDANIAREEIKWQTSQGTNRSFIRVGGSYADNALEFGTGNAILGMILHANGGLSIGTTVATTLPPASGLLVQGNVGIGTTTPTMKLQIKSPSGDDGIALIQSSSRLELVCDAVYLLGISINILL